MIKSYNVDISNYFYFMEVRNVRTKKVKTGTVNEVRFLKSIAEYGLFDRIRNSEKREELYWCYK